MLTNGEVKKVEMLILTGKDISDGFLDDFTRYQQTTKVYVQESRVFVEQQDSFIDDWDIQQRQKITEHLRKTADGGGAVISIMKGGKLVGFSVIEPEPFGTNDCNLELSYIHVSADYRGQGIGEKLFNPTKEIAKRMGATKLYIGAHPSVETQHFYRKMGCVPAKEIHPAIYDREPRDLQLEVSI